MSRRTGRRRTTALALGGALLLGLASPAAGTGTTGTAAPSATEGAPAEVTPALPEDAQSLLDGGDPLSAYVPPTAAPPADAGPDAATGDAMAMNLPPEQLYPCPGYSSIPSTNPASQVMKDQFAWSKYPARSVRQAGGAAGNINWRSNPTGDVSWFMWLHSLRWLGHTIESGKLGNAAHLQHSAKVARDWYQDNPYSFSGNPAAAESVSHRTDVLICLRHATTAYFGGVVPNHPDYNWIDTALRQHARFLADHYSGAWNHGTDESMSLLGIGCVLGDRPYADLAVQRLESAVTTAIDPEGATNEQSTGYAIFNYNLWGSAEKAMSQCGYDPTNTISKRRALLASFIAHSSMPNGRVVQIGDSEDLPVPLIPGTEAEYAATQGASGPRPAARVAVYDHEGYVYGRTGWGEDRPYSQESGYSIRFGPGRQLHGHDDRPAVTYHSRGRDVLVDSGHQGYVNDGWRTYQKSGRSHSQLVVPTAAFNPAAPVRLTRSLVSDTQKMEFFEFQDSAYAGVTRTRGVLVLEDPDVMIVLDRASSRTPQAYRQLWQLPSDQVGSVYGRSTVTATSAGAATSTVLFQTAYGGALPRGATQVVRGQTSPEIQGWRFPKLYTRDKATTATMARSGTTASILTVVAPVPTGRGVTYTLKPAADGWTNLDMVVAGKSVRVRISPGGYLGRG